jgi:drug/metabolite transporter (DMT)-like permease
MKSISLQTDPLAFKLYVILGLFSYVIPFGLVYWAEQFIPSGLASVLFAIFPFFVIIFSRIAIPGETIDLFKITGVILGFSGILVIFSANLAINLTTQFWGMLAVFLSAVMQAAISVIIKRWGKPLNPLSMNLIPLLIGGVVLIWVGLFFEDSTYWVFDDKAILSIIYLAFFGTVITFTTYYWLLKRINIVILSLSAFITPIIAVILGWLILDEQFSTRDLIGSSLVLIGILFANFVGLKNYILYKNISNIDDKRN